ncbi:MAG: hypothetical protein ACHQ3P_10800, partial [Candidatus Limnocylindrales bacterium]
AGAVGPTEPPFLIEHDQTAAEWTPAERAARAAEMHPIGGSLRLKGLEIVVPDPVAWSKAYRRSVGLDSASSSPESEPGDAVALSVGDQEIVLRASLSADGNDGSAPRATIRLSTSGVRSATADLFGCRFMIEAG